jgi:hypothetical protein
VQSFLRISFTMTFASALAAGSALEVNHGQFAPEVRFAASSGAASTAITGSGIAFRSRRPNIALRLDYAWLDACASDSPVESDVNHLELEPPLLHVPLYSSVVCHSVYPGIDWIVRTNGSRVEHDWRVAAGADARKIRLTVDNRASAQITPQGDLLLQSEGLAVIWKERGTT